MQKRAVGSFVINSGNEVEVRRPHTLSDYVRATLPQELDEIKSLTKKFTGKRVAFFNSTPQGGGVAIMRQALIPLLRSLGVDVHWYVLLSDPRAFLVTKQKIHNVLQGVSPPSVRLTEEDRNVYTHWMSRNSVFFADVIKKSHIIVIDDPQPSGLIPHIRRDNPSAVVIYRSHIQIDTEFLRDRQSPQWQSWRFVWAMISGADHFVFHPVPDFVPEDVPRASVSYMPATTDPIADLNRDIKPAEAKREIAAFQKILKETGQTPLSFTRRYSIQIARFDPSKGIPDVLVSFRKLAEYFRGHMRDLPQLVLVGNGSVDDPDGPTILNQTMQAIQSDAFDGLRNHIKVAMLPPDDLLLNTLLRKSSVVLQLSRKEGFEIKVTEALMKGKPVVVYKTGGIPLQVKENVNGFVLPRGDTGAVADRMHRLFSDGKLYTAMSECALRYYDRSFTTIPSAIRWMKLWARLDRKL